MVCFRVLSCTHGTCCHGHQSPAAHWPESSNQIRRCIHCVDSPNLGNGSNPNPPCPFLGVFSCVRERESAMGDVPRICVGAEAGETNPRSPWMLSSEAEKFGFLQHSAELQIRNPNTTILPLQRMNHFGSQWSSLWKPTSDASFKLLCFSIGIKQARQSLIDWSTVDVGRLLPAPPTRPFCPDRPTGGNIHHFLPGQ